MRQQNAIFDVLPIPVFAAEKTILTAATRLMLRRACFIAIACACARAAPPSHRIAARAPANELRASSVRQQQEPTFVVYVRVFADAPYIEAFFNHYLALGFDKIIALDVIGQVRTDGVSHPERVQVVRVPQNLGNDLYKEHWHLVKESGARWVLTVDTDEFLLIDAPSIGAFVARIERKHGEMVLFYFRWVMLDWLAPWCGPSVGSMIVGSESARAALTMHTFHKNMARVARVTGVRPHCANFARHSKEVALYDDGTPLVMRASSICRNVNRYPNASRSPAYADSTLVHVHTRSLHDLVQKALLTAFPLKKIKDRSALSELMRAAPTMQPGELLHELLRVVGTKANRTLKNLREVPAHFKKAYGLGTSFVRAKLRALLAEMPGTTTNSSFCVPRIEREQACKILSAAAAGADQSPSEAVTLEEYETFLKAVSRSYVDAWHPR
jgi:hypothetical protein